MHDRKGLDRLLGLFIVQKRTKIREGHLITKWTNYFARGSFKEGTRHSTSWPPGSRKQVEKSKNAFLVEDYGKRH